MSRAGIPNNKHLGLDEKRVPLATSVKFTTYDGLEIIKRQRGLIAKGRVVDALVEEELKRTLEQ